MPAEVAWVQGSANVQRAAVACAVLGNTQTAEDMVPEVAQLS